ncbi:MAG: RNA 2',3'-cyclic phosphodiesterase [Deltaproteobacteria bacterium]|nr:RNA 2',3'-cyclic phosphodiesterase [Deltaproteobacteria bacterium]
MKTVRCFLAVNLDLKTAAKISELQQHLIKETRAYQTKFRWVPPQNMHVTVRFLGNITEPMIQAIKDTLEIKTREMVPVQMEAGNIGVFDTESPRVLYCSINDPSGALNEMVRQVHEVLVNIGFKEAEKPYAPHVTLARLENADLAEITKLTDAFREPMNCISTVRTLVCYQSDMVSSGVDYQLLWKLPLQKRPHSRSNPPGAESALGSMDEMPDATDSPSDDDYTSQMVEENSPSDADDDQVMDDGDGKTGDDNFIGSDSEEQGEQE